MRQEGTLRYETTSGITEHRFARSGLVRCKSCAKENQLEFGAELIVHFPGLEGLDKPIVWVFPKLVACMNCGFTEFAIPETELAVLVRGTGRSDAAGQRESSEDVTTP